VVPGCPRHVTQRGNRRADVFFCDADRNRDLALLAEESRQTRLRQRTRTGRAAVEISSPELKLCWADLRRQPSGAQSRTAPAKSKTAANN
jgi:hypothetical protein